MAIEIVDFPMKHGGSFLSYVSLPEGTPEHQVTNLAQSLSAPASGLPQWKLPRWSVTCAVTARPGKGLRSYGRSPSLIGKSSIKDYQSAIFHTYAISPERNMGVFLKCGILEPSMSTRKQSSICRLDELGLPP